MSSSVQLISSATFANQRKALLRLIDELRDIDIRNELDLPRIVVVGNQSVGKSSLIEAIAGVAIFISPLHTQLIPSPQIELPRAAGTCTRCAMEIRLHQADEPWRAVVKLHRKYHEGGATGNVDFGSTLTNMAMVQDRLRRAQLAILNPDKPYETYLAPGICKNIGSEGSSKRFSRNVVCIDIWDRHLTDLTFIDLPGIISGTRDPKHKTDIKLIQDLVSLYLGGESVILLAISMSEDYEISSAVQMVRDADDKGERTVGVLTKADRAKSANDQWLPVLQNLEAPLKYGYYATRQRDSTVSETKHGVQDEEQFFASTEPWASSVHLHTRMGTTKLVQGLSDLFSRRIASKLPDIKKRIISDLTKARRELHMLGAPSPDPVHAMANLCQTFKSGIENRVLPADGAEDLIQKINEHSDRFRKDLFMTTPRFLPFLKSTYEQRAMDKSEASNKSREASDESEEPSDGSEDTFLDGKILLRDDVFPSVIKTDDNDALTEIYDKTIESLDLSASQVCDLCEVRGLLRMAQARQLPGFVPFSVVRKLIRRSTEQWSAIIERFLRGLSPLVEEALHELSYEVFGQYEHSDFAQTVICLADGTLSRLLNDARAILLRLEGLDDIPYTQNTHYYEALQQKFLAHYRQKRRSTNGTGIKYIPVTNSTTKEKYTEAEAFSICKQWLGFFNVPCDSKDDLAQLLEPDEYDEELKIMAAVHAYFKVTFKRAIDNYPRAVDEYVLQPLAEAVFKDLHNHLRLYSSGDANKRCTELLAFSPVVKIKYESLTSKVKMLEKGLDRMDQHALGSMGGN